MVGVFSTKFHDQDLLCVVFDPEAVPTATKQVGNAIALYQGDKLVGLNVFGIVEKFYTGLNPLPSEDQLSILNKAMAALGLPALNVSDSGFHVATVVNKEEHPLDERKHILTVKEGEKTFTTTTRYANIEIGSKIVVLHDSFFRHDGTAFHASVIRNIPQDVEVCSYADLHLEKLNRRHATSVSSEELGRTAYLANGLEEGVDFYR